MNKPQFYLSQCMEAASKSPMYYTLGSAIIKGGKVVSTGYNHQRPNYDTPGGGKPLSMHAEMASIFNATRGQVPALKYQRAAEEEEEEKQPKKHHHHIHLQQQRQQQQQGEGNYTTNGAYYNNNNYPNGNNNTTTNSSASAVRCPLVPSRDLDSRPRPRRAPYAVSTAPARRMDSATRHQLHHHHQGQQYRHYPYGYEGEGTESERGRKARAKADAGKWQKRATAGRRIRLAKLNGADLYVCRVTRSGELACSKPCWRCIEWCAWAGIKRIFHWSVLEQRFICLKVAEAAATHDCYETVMDSRLLAPPAAVLLRG
ncbi:CMP/dCMP-type deaminase domain-containing protein [Mycena chlorophos]|uniref:CMP/dCMP-type deaminase domain-containing protein n=1 Tax=Mycena chlorophos TaxID=658473 RepID=A0A8H6WJQ3_MYCCL|nr:CMP/dCMP-type deaminase domain-containing protein [Mycena chlorophos]